MPTLSADAWYLICQKLHLPDRLRFSSTHRYAREILGDYQTQRTQYWNSIFKSYEWVDAFKLQHLTPVLVFPEKEGSYIYLFMVKRKNATSDKCHVSQDDDDATPEQLTEARISLFKTIRKSLRSYAPGENPWEMQFENFTLNMSSILLPGAPTGLKCPQLFDDPSRKNVEIAVYEGGVKELKLDVLYGKVAFSKSSEFERIMFIRLPGDSCGGIPLKSLNLT